jgi:SAM-dependent methyltransferase
MDTIKNAQESFMGVAYVNAALMAKARNTGASFAKMLTIGHLNLTLSARQVQKIAELLGSSMDVHGLNSDRYADRFFAMLLGAQKVTSLDVSDYEGCDLIHDMNLPIAPIYHEQFDAVVDGGSIEHVFNFPIAMANCMKVLKKNGNLFILTTANNHMGHGFYQFSPDLFFRIFRRENGFEICEIVLIKHPYPGLALSRKIKCYTVTDPAVLKRRVGLVSRSPVLIMVHARRVDITPIFQSFPIQSDYAHKHATYAAARNQPSSHSLLPSAMWAIAKRLRMQRSFKGAQKLMEYSFLNRKHYKKWRLPKP